MVSTQSNSAFTYSMSAPTISVEEEKQEWDELTEEEKEKARSDLFGRCSSSNENCEARASKLLSLLEQELEKIPQERKHELMEAGRRCPDEIDNEHKLMFLRCEEFDAKRAAERLVEYWKCRVQVFGPDKAYGPTTIEKAFEEDDMYELSLGYLQFMPFRDVSGRAIIFVDPSRKSKEKYSRQRMMKAMWYVLHATMDDSDTAKAGAIVVSCYRQITWGEFDRKMSNKFTRCAVVFPFQIQALHMCHPPKYAEFLLPLIKFLVGHRLRHRFEIHSGSDERVLQSLSSYGLPRDRLPKEIGGEVVLDHEKWIKERRARGA